MGRRRHHLPSVAGPGSPQTPAPTMAQPPPPTGPPALGVGASPHKLTLRSWTHMRLAQAVLVIQHLVATGTMTQTTTLTSRPLSQH